MQTRIGQLETHHSARGNITHSLDIWHDGLKKHRTLRDSNLDVIRRKAQLQAEEWDEKWSEVCTKNEERQIRYTGKLKQDQARSEAAQRTAQAQAVLDELQNLLVQSLSKNDAVDWRSLKDDTPFPEPPPVQGAIPEAPSLTSLPIEPSRGGLKYRPRIGLLDFLLSSRKAQKEAGARALFESDHANWAKELHEIKVRHSEAVKEHERYLEATLQTHTKETKQWLKRKEKYDQDQIAANLAIDVKRSAYELRDPAAIVDYCDLVLSRSTYPDFFPKDFELQYDESAKLLIVDYQLPAPDDLPTLKAVRYIASRDQAEEQHLSESAVSKQYDDVLYQIVLRTIHELFEADVITAIDTIAMNGIVTATDKRTGRQVTSCILSLRTNRREFSEINLGAVEPKACFKALKGVGSAKLVGLSPVAPIMPLNREDRRFVEAHAVAQSLDESINLAAMDWEEFEHLIRELFAAEFASNGGDVKVTQASRDGGVDAVAFDPDPIRGGKIVIQAKRYTNTVPVSAVRDLWGTVMNEGATKGVLVTTSDYGGDSYGFANGKPLLLMNGSNLLHLLEKHGHRAKIDLRAAKLNSE